MSNMKILNRIKSTLLCAFFITAVAQAQSIGTIANYPLITSLADSTGSNSTISLQGDVPPAPPSQGVELCSNGVSLFELGGQGIQTPIITDFDISNFQIELEFKPIALPSISEIPHYPVIMGGLFAPWVGILVDPDGRIGLKFNGSDLTNIWSNTLITAASYHTARLRYNNGATDLFINDSLTLSESLPDLIPFQDDFNFAITDFSNGLTFHGCIRNLKISSPTDVLFKAGFE
ncbi:MAG: hypothetical protein JKY19_15630 [Alcanivoracaceae bacterium]|nr:hypothetical protein [Alcanivoracaceae bacterium]